MIAVYCDGEWLINLTPYLPHFVVSLTQLAVVPVAKCVDLPRVEQHGGVEGTAVNLHDGKVVGERHDSRFLCGGHRGLFSLGSLSFSRNWLFWFFNTGLSWRGGRE